MEYYFNGHKVEFSQGSSSLDPWSSEYCQKINLGLMCTSDIVPYVLIDDEKIYRLDNGCYNGVISSYDEFMYNVQHFCGGRYIGELPTFKKEFDEMKIREEAFKKMSPEEKKAEIERRREARRLKIIQP